MAYCVGSNNINRTEADTAQPLHEQIIHRSAFHVHRLLAEPIHALELLFDEHLKSRHLHTDRRSELNAQLLPAMATPDSGDHLSSFVVIGVDGEVPRQKLSHVCF